MSMILEELHLRLNIADQGQIMNNIYGEGGGRSTDETWPLH
jgi:hypothetical protein